MKKYKVHSDKTLNKTLKAIEEAFNKGEQFTVYLLPPKKNRGLQFNKYYFGVVVKTISNYLGYSPQETHDILKQLHNSRGYTLKNGGVLTVAEDTSTLNNTEFDLYVQRVRIWANDELGLQIPLPNELNDEHYEYLFNNNLI